MKEIATIQVIDLDSKSNVVAIVRAGKGRVGICLSIREDGDVEVVLKPEDCGRILQALHHALTAATTSIAS